MDTPPIINIHLKQKDKSQARIEEIQIANKCVLKYPTLLVVRDT